MRKFRMEQLQSHIWLTASSKTAKNFRISSCIRKPFLRYDFATAPFWISLYMSKIWFSFYQCGGGAQIYNCYPRQYKSKDVVRSDYISHLSMQGGRHIFCSPTGLSLLVGGSLSIGRVKKGLLREVRIVLLLRPLLWLLLRNSRVL